MTTLYNGGPVMGGTFPALIWASVISAWQEIKAERGGRSRRRKGGEGEPAKQSTANGRIETYDAPMVEDEAVRTAPNRRPKKRAGAEDGSARAEAPHPKPRRKRRRREQRRRGRRWRRASRAG